MPLPNTHPEAPAHRNFHRAQHPNATTASPATIYFHHGPNVNILIFLSDTSTRNRIRHPYNHDTSRVWPLKSQSCFRNQLLLTHYVHTPREFAHGTSGLHSTAKFPSCRPPISTSLSLLRSARNCIAHVEECRQSSTP